MKKLRYPLNVTIDTNIFEANHFDFGTGSTMSVLAKQIQNGKVKLVLSDIVIREVEKHISNRVDEVCGKARKLRQDYLHILPEQYLTNIGLELYIQIPEKGTIHEKAQKVFADFISHCNVERLNTGGINIEKVLDDYFSVCPPFENSEKKRKEFPDAFIAEEIKNRFGSDETVAIISQDKQCTENLRIDYEVEDVLEALESLILKLRDELDDEQDLAASIKTIIEKCE